MMHPFLGKEMKRIRKWNKIAGNKLFGGFGEKKVSKGVQTCE